MARAWICVGRSFLGTCSHTPCAPLLAYQGRNSEDGPASPLHVGLLAFFRSSSLTVNIAASDWERIRFHDRCECGRWLLEHRAVPPPAGRLLDTCARRSAIRGTGPWTPRAAQAPTRGRCGWAARCSSSRPPLRAPGGGRKDTAAGTACPTGLCRARVEPQTPTEPRAGLHAAAGPVLGRVHVPLV